MERNALIDRCKNLIKEAYEEATEMIVAYLEIHPDEGIKPLAREIDPENWSALESRIRRAQKRRAAANGESDATAVPDWKKRDKRDAKRMLRDSDPTEIADILEDPEVRQNLAAAGKVHELRQENRTGIPSRNPPTGPTFIGTVLKLNGWLDELVGMVERGEAQIPPEFSTQSLSDIGVKAMRLKELVDNVRQGEEVLS